MVCCSLPTDTVCVVPNAVTKGICKTQRVHGPKKNSFTCGERFNSLARTISFPFSKIFTAFISRRDKFCRACAKPIKRGICPAVGKCRNCGYILFCRSSQSPFSSWLLVTKWAPLWRPPDMGSCSRSGCTENCERCCGVKRSCAIKMVWSQ